MRLPPKETIKDISSGDPIATVIDARPVILKPEDPEYQSAFESIYGKNPRSEEMAAKTGSIDKTEEVNHKVHLFPDHLLDFPELWYNVCLVGPPEDTKGFPHLFARAMCTGVEEPEEADIVVFTGGPDVDPAYYGTKRHDKTYYDSERDYADIGVYMTCFEKGIPMVGVCRGAQFLAVMNGYKLFQDVDNHNGDHTMWDCEEKILLEKVSSVHHQQVIHGAGMDIVAVSYESHCRDYDNNRRQTASGDRPFTDLEAFFIRDTCCFGVQGHPEYKGYNAFAKWFLTKIYNFTTLNNDLDWRDGNRLRMLPSLLEERHLSVEQQEQYTMEQVIGE